MKPHPHRDAIIRAYEKGDTLRAIAARYKTSPSKVSRIAVNAGLPSRHPGRKRIGGHHNKTDPRQRARGGVPEYERGLANAVKRGWTHFWSQKGRTLDLATNHSFNGNF